METLHVRVVMCWGCSYGNHACDIYVYIVERDGKEMETLQVQVRVAMP